MNVRRASILSGAMLLIGLAGCSDVGPGLKNHPMDCAIGVAWADCLPGTPGFRGTPAQLAYQGVYQRQANEAAQRNRRIEAANDEAQRCIERRKAGELPNYVASAQCINGAMERGFRETRDLDMDLVLAVSATRLRAAEQIDKGEITEGEALIRIANKISEITAEARRRRADDMRANADITNTYAQARAAEAQEENARQLQYLGIFGDSSRVTRTTTCTNYGNTRQCTTRE